jgi:hypothetical protein
MPPSFRVIGPGRGHLWGFCCIVRGWREWCFGDWKPFAGSVGIALSKEMGHFWLAAGQTAPPRIPSNDSVSSWRDRVEMASLPAARRRLGEPVP